MRTASRLPPDTSTSGTGDILDQLQQDHRHVESLFAQAWTTRGELRRSAVQQIVRQLTEHSELEEQFVYPALAAAVGGGEVLAGGAVEEHAEIKDLLERVQQPDADGPTLVEDLWALQVVVQQHVTVEEAVLWPALRQAVTPGDLAALTTAAEPARAGGAKVGARKPKR